MKAVEAAFNQGEGTMLCIVGDYTTSNFTKDLLRLYYFYLSISIISILLLLDACVRFLRRPVWRGGSSRCVGRWPGACAGAGTPCHLTPLHRHFYTVIQQLDHLCHGYCPVIVSCSVCDYLELVWDIFVIYLMRLPNVRSPKLADGPVPCNVFLIMMM